MAGLFESELSYLYLEAFDGIEAELAYQSFRENKGRHYAYSLVNAIYDEKDKVRKYAKGGIKDLRLRHYALAFLV